MLEADTKMATFNPRPLAVIAWIDFYHVWCRGVDLISGDPLTVYVMLAGR